MRSGEAIRKFERQRAGQMIGLSVASVSLWIANGAMAAATQTVNSSATGDIGSSSVYTSPNVVPSNGDSLLADGTFSLTYGTSEPFNSLVNVGLNPTLGAGTFTQTGNLGITGTLTFGGNGPSRHPTYIVDGGTLTLAAISYNYGMGTTLSAKNGGIINFTGATGSGNITLAPGISGQTPVSSLTLDNSTLNDTSTTSAASIFLGNAAGSTSASATLTLTGASALNASTIALVLGQAGNASTVGTVNLSGTSTIKVASVSFGGTSAATAQYGVFNLNGGNLTTGSLRLGVSTTTPTATANVFNATGGTVTASAASATFFSGLYLNQGTGGLTFDTNGNAVTFTPSTYTGTGGLTKVGAGALTVGVNATYTGDTAINAGTFVANTTGTGNSATGSGTVTVANGAALVGGTKTSAGRIAGSVLLSSGSTISAGNGISTSNTVGTLATGSETWNAGAKYVVKVNAGNITGTAAGGAGAGDATADLLTMAGGLTGPTSGVFNIQLLGLSGTTTFADGSELVIASQPASTAATFQSLIDANLIALSTSGTFASSGQLGLAGRSVGGLDELVVTVVPEPATVVTVAGALMLALGRRRRFCIGA